MADTQLLCPLMVRCSLAAATSHPLISLGLFTSPPLETRVVLSGLYARDDTDCWCPLRVACTVPVLRSHTLMVRSGHDAASVLPSGLYTARFERPGNTP